MAFEGHAKLLEAAQALDLKQPVLLLKDTATIDPVAVVTVYMGPQENPSESKEFIAHNLTSHKMDLLCRQALDFLREYYSGDASKMQYLREPVCPSKSAWEQSCNQMMHSWYALLESTTALHIQCYDSAQELNRLKRLDRMTNYEFERELHETLAEQDELREIVESKKRYIKELEASIAARRSQLGLSPCTSTESGEDGDGDDGAASGSDTSES